MIPLIKNKKTSEYDSAFSSKLWLFEDVEKEEYLTQLEEIKNAGFSFVYETVIEENVTNVFKGDEGLVFSSFYPCDNTVRTIFETNKNLPEYEMRDNLENKAKTTLWQFEVDHSLIDCGMCYIIRCCDGSFFVVDSAHTYSCRDDERIHDFLRERTPQGEKIKIAGWFFSHGHDDHIAQFTNFLKYCSSDVEIEGLYFNFPTFEHRDAHDWMGAGAGYVKQFRDAIEKRTDIPVYTLHSGERFFIRNLKFDVLCSHEDVFPQSLEDYNNSSIASMMTVDGNKISFPGDASAKESVILERRFPEFLKCDIMQVSHHGHFGTSPEFYRLSDARVALFPVTEIKFDEEYPRVEANRVACERAEHTYIAGHGTVMFTFPLENSKILIYPDETNESFQGIFNLWNYEYTDEFKAKNVAAYEARSSFREEDY